MSETPPPIQKKQKLIYWIFLCSLVGILAVCALVFFLTYQTHEGQVRELVAQGKKKITERQRSFPQKRQETEKVKQRVRQKTAPHVKERPQTARPIDVTPGSTPPPFKGKDSYSEKLRREAFGDPADTTDERNTNSAIRSSRSSNIEKARAAYKQRIDSDRIFFIQHYTYVDQKSGEHMINYDAIKKANPTVRARFAHFLHAWYIRTEKEKNPNTPNEELHASGAHERLYERAEFEGGTVMPSRTKPGHFVLVNPVTGKKISNVGGASRNSKVRRQQENARRIAARPEYYKAKMIEAARRRMRIEAKWAWARGDNIRAAMLELDIDDPSHPLVLARAFNDRSFLIPLSPPQSQGGSYAHLIDPPNVASGKEFSQSQKQEILAENMRKNNGVLRSDLSHKQGYEPRKYEPRDDEVHIDHIIPQSKGGSNSFSNAQVLLRIENLQKGATLGNF